MSFDKKFTSSQYIEKVKSNPIKLIKNPQVQINENIVNFNKINSRNINQTIKQSYSGKSK
jgi:hypothetical protein